MSFRAKAFAAVFAAVAGLAGAAAAQDAAHYKGEYLSGQIGVNDLRSSNHTGTGFGTEAKFDHDLIGAFALGHAFGNGLRVEGEFARRDNDASTVGGVTATGAMKAHSFMINGLYDFATGGWIVPYIGGGLGFAKIESDIAPVGGSAVTGSDVTLAWQAIVGAAVPLADGWELTADLRYFDANEPSFGLASGGKVDAEYRDTSFLVGLRWRFGAAAAPPRAEPVAAPAPAPQPAPVAQPRPEPAPAPAPQPAPAPAPVKRSFLIFFDWDRSNIRADAQKILEAAAAAAKQGNLVSIQLTGHADRSGPVGYNQRLSVRRAVAAKAALVKLGLSAGSIATIGRGETQPLVATADGVREPRNRRVEIVF